MLDSDLPVAHQRSSECVRSRVRAGRTRERIVIASIPAGTVIVTRLCKASGTVDPYRTARCGAQADRHYALNPNGSPTFSI